MKYVEAYNKLQNIGAIRNIMTAECKNGANPSMVKNYIITAIWNYITFTASERFYEMNYYVDISSIISDDAKMGFRIRARICKTLAVGEILGKCDYNKELVYMTAAYRDALTKLQ
jgi:hypothetical protein